jgi:hypothetical protein
MGIRQGGERRIILVECGLSADVDASEITVHDIPRTPAIRTTDDMDWTKLLPDDNYVLLGYACSVVTTHR